MQRSATTTDEEDTVNKPNDVKCGKCIHWKAVCVGFRNESNCERFGNCCASASPSEWRLRAASDSCGEGREKPNLLDYCPVCGARLERDDSDCWCSECKQTFS